MSKPTLPEPQLIDRIRQEMFLNKSLAGRCGDIGIINIVQPKGPSSSGWDAELINTHTPADIQAVFECAKRKIQGEFDLQRPPLGGLFRHR